MDARVLEGGLGSGLWAPFRRGNSFVGGVWLSAREKHALQDVYPGPTLERLRDIKTKWDPDNVFRRNFNIPPQGTR